METKRIVDHCFRCGSKKLIGYSTIVCVECGCTHETSDSEIVSWEYTSTIGDTDTYKGAKTYTTGAELLKKS